MHVHPKNGKELARKAGIIPGDGLLEGRAKDVSSRRDYETERYELRKVGSVQHIQTKGEKVYNLQIDGIPAYETIIGLTHNTQKPVALAERAIKKSSKPGDIVMDLFGGSFSTMIGCQKLGRRFRGSDLDPAYVSVGVTRWCNFMGNNKVVKNGKGIEW